MPNSRRYLFNAIPDTNHNANLTNLNRYSKGKADDRRPIKSADFIGRSIFVGHTTDKIDRQPEVELGSNFADKING